jgi:hypothetical protein
MMKAELYEETIDRILLKLRDVMNILTKEIPLEDPDMDVIEWNASPVGRAVNLLDDIMGILEESIVE